MHASANPAIPPAIKWVEGATLGLLLTFLLSAGMVRANSIKRSEEFKKRKLKWSGLLVGVVLYVLCWNLLVLALLVGMGK